MALMRCLRGSSRAGFFFFDEGLSWTREHPEGPKSTAAGCTPSRSEFLRGGPRYSYRLVHTGLGWSSLVAHVLHYPPAPHANSFLIGTAVINTHTYNGLRPKHTKGTYVLDDDLMVVPAKPRRSPRPATPIAACLSD